MDNNTFISGSWPAHLFHQSIPNEPYDYIASFYKKYNNVLEEYEISEDQTCIIFYKTVDYPFYHKELYRIYKSIKDFKEKFELDKSKLDEKFGIDLEVWIYD